MSGAAEHGAPRPRDHAENEHPAAPRQPDDIDAAVTVLRAMAYEHRLRILLHLLHGEATAAALSAALVLDPTGLAHHLRHLRTARLIHRQRNGQHVRYRLDDDARPLLRKLMRYASNGGQ
jgi:DNA-binding transcriptional ArsR family regulator